MKIKLKFFASYREITGKSESELQVKSGETVSGMLAILRQAFPALPLADSSVAINQEFASPASVLRDGDEVALLPPVSGG